jgi:hypothetical protein
MSKEVFEPIRQGLEDALAMVESPDFVLQQQVAIALNALQQISLGDAGGEVGCRAVAKEAMKRIVDLIPPSPHSEKGE